MASLSMRCETGKLALASLRAIRRITSHSQAMRDAHKEAHANGVVLSKRRTSAF